MALRTSHPKGDLIRYHDGEVDQEERRNIEKHLETCQSCQELLSFVRDFNQGLAEIEEPVPVDGEQHLDTWTLVSLEEGMVDEETARGIRSHLIFCDRCADLYDVSLRSRPKLIDLWIRVARGVVEAIFASVELPAPVQVPIPQTLGPNQWVSIPFSLEETITDPDTGRSHSITLKLEDDPFNKQFDVVDEL